MAASGNEIQVLCVCTHNRTRSVMMEAFLDRHLDVAEVPHRLVSAGLHGNGGRATHGALEQLGLRGYDASDHLSRLITASDVETSDLIITAEALHVAEISGVWHDAFERAFTLPELIARSNGLRTEGSLADWLRAINEGRPTALDYLDSDVGEIADPTGAGPSQWRASARTIDELTAQLATSLAGLDLGLDRRPGRASGHT